MAHIFNLSPEGAELCAFQVIEGTHAHKILFFTLSNIWVMPAVG